MTLDKLSEYINQSEALTNYARVTEDLAKAYTSIQRLNEQLSLTQKVLKQTSHEKKDLQERFEERIEELQKIQASIMNKDRKLQEVSRQNTKLMKRISDLEGLMQTTDRKTLREVEQAMLQAQQAEITSQATAKFTGMQAEWEETEKPNEVLEEAAKWLNSIITILQKPPPRYFPKQLMDLDVPNKVSSIITAEVDRRKDDEFYRQVDQESDRRAQTKLTQLTMKAWPKWLEVNIMPKIHDLAQQITVDPLRAVNRAWSITCEKCRTPVMVTLTDQHMADLLTKRWTYIQDCPNPSCKDQLRYPHRIQATLSDLIAGHLQI